MKPPSNLPDSVEEFPVPSGVWTVIPPADIQVYHTMGHVCRVRFHHDQKTVEFLDGGKWAFKKWAPPPPELSIEEIYGPPTGDGRPGWAQHYGL